MSLDALPTVNMGANGVGTVTFGQAETLNVNFYRKAVHDKARSAQMGSPQYVSKDYVRIQIPGEKDYTDQPVDDDPSVTQRFALHWARYQQNQTQVPDGTPVEMLFVQHPEIAAMLHGRGVHVVEQLANLTAEGQSQIGMGATQWVTAAKKFLETAKRGVEYHHLTKELEKRDGQIEVLSNQIAGLKQLVERLSAQKDGTAQPHILPVERTMPIASQVAAEVPSPYFGGSDLPTEAPAVLAPALTETPAPQAPKRRGRPPGPRKQPSN